MCVNDRQSVLRSPWLKALGGSAIASRSLGAMSPNGGGPSTARMKSKRSANSASSCGVASVE